MSPVYRLVKVFPAHSHPSKIVEYACFSTAVSRLAHERQRLLEGHPTSREFLLVDLKRATRSEERREGKAASLIMEGAEFKENIINGVERTVRVDELFAFT